MEQKIFNYKEQVEREAQWNNVILNSIIAVVRFPPLPDFISK